MGEDGGLWGWKGMGVPMADGGDGVSMGMGSLWALGTLHKAKGKQQPHNPP